MSISKVPGLGIPAVKSVVDKGEMDVNDLATALRKLDDDSQPSPEPKPEVEIPEVTEKLESDDAAVAVEEGSEDALSKIEKTDDASEPTSDPAELEYPKFKKRVDTLTAQKKEAQARIAELEQQLEQANQVQPKEAEAAAPATAANPFLNITNYSDLRREEASTEGVIEWCDANEDGAVVKQADGSERDYTAKEIRDVRRNAEKALRKHIPAQHEYLRQREHFDQQAVESYNWWKDKTTAEYQQAAQVLRAFPELAKFPDYKLTVGDFVEGFKSRTAKGVKAPAAVKKAPAQPSTQSATPAAVPPSKVSSDAARSRFNTTGDVSDLEKVISAMM